MAQQPGRPAREVVLHGIGVSPGVVYGPVHVLTREAVYVVERRIGEDEIPGELARLEQALIDTRRRITRVQQKIKEEGSGGESGIFDAHLMVLDDTALVGEIVEAMRRRRVNVEVAVRDASRKYANALAAVEDPYIRERVADVKDVARRLIRSLCGRDDAAMHDVPLHYIVVASDLSPSETASMRSDMVVGFATDLGSPTSHTAVMARALEIPAIVGLRDVTRKVATGDEVLIDGNKGVMVIRPSDEQLKNYGKVAEARNTIAKGLEKLRSQPAETRDGHRIVLLANLEQPEEMDAVVQYGAEGIGLFRSEYLWMTRGRAVGEEEQYREYRAVISRLAPAPVVIRTLDLGGDKFVEAAERVAEANPFLGCRSIRYSLQHPEEFKRQLRAILRAGADGNARVMYPMISSVAEVIRANELLEESKQDLEQKGIPYDNDMKAGVMVEIPAAALTANEIAPHASFFSIGTNDLIQYTVAVDRGNERVAYLYEPTHPAVLRLIKETVDAGHHHNLPVGVCGEMGADPVMTPLLIGLGVDQLSVAPSAVPLVKDVVRSVRRSQAQALAETARKCHTAQEVLSHSRKLMREIAPEILELF